MCRWFLGPKWRVLHLSPLKAIQLVFRFFRRLKPHMSFLTADDCLFIAVPREGWQKLRLKDIGFIIQLPQQGWSQKLYPRLCGAARALWPAWSRPGNFPTKPGQWEDTWSILRWNRPGHHSPEALGGVQGTNNDVSGENVFHGHQEWEADKATSCISLKTTWGKVKSCFTRRVSEF